MDNSKQREQQTANEFPPSPRRSKAHVYRVMVTCGLLSFLILSIHPFPAQAFSQTHPPDFAGIDRYVTAHMQEAHIPGLALGIVHGNHIVHLRGFGVAHPAGQPVTPQTPFILGSFGHLKRQPGVLRAHALLLVAWEIGVPLLLVIGLPFLFSTPWPVMLLYQPDIISWLMGIMLLSTGGSDPVKGW